MPRTPKRATGEPAHAAGKRHVALPGNTPAPQGRTAAKAQHDQPWVPKSGLVGRSRRSARRG